MMMNDAICRPKEITCDGIWELYKTLEGLKNRYLWVDLLEKAEADEKLTYLEKVTLGEDGMIYEAPDSMGIELPYSKDEWVQLVLKDVENGKSKRIICKIKVNALRNVQVSPEELLKRNHLRIAEVDDLKGVTFEREKSYDDEPGAMIPVNDHPVPIQRTYAKKGGRVGAMARDFKDYLKSFQIPYKEDVDMGVRRFSFVFMCENAPGGFVEGCIWFFDKAAEVRTYYNSIGADVCRRSEYRAELYRLLNFINARVYMACSDGGNGTFDSAMLYTPRMYLTEDDGFDVSITTIINYDFWRLASYETHTYVTAYCPELLDRFAPYVYGVLEGKLSAEDAISGMKRTYSLD